MDAKEAVRTYKSLSRVEQAFRSLKSVDLHIRPIYHHLDDRVRAHIFLCMLAYYVEWHMRQRLAPLLFDDEHKEEMAENQNIHGCSCRQLALSQQQGYDQKAKDDMPVSSFQTLLRTLSTLSRNTLSFKIPGSQNFYRNTGANSLTGESF